MLNILIPTFNRIEFLLDNLVLLSEIIKKGNFEENVSIIISDNCSTDDTFSAITQFKNEVNTKIELYRQDVNIGLKNNALFVLEKSTSDYVMYLGDDDFISYEYLIACIGILNNDPDTSVIVPNYVPVSVDNVIVDDSRDPIGAIQKYPPGFSSILHYSWKGHQLSGLVFKRNGLLEDYKKFKVDNIYLFIFFVAVSGLKGTSYQIKDYPVRVTQPVKKKDWGYGDDGLVNEIFDNYRKLPVTYVQRFKLEFNHLLQQWWRLFMYRQQGTGLFFKALLKIAFAKNASLLFSASIPVLLVLIKLRLKLK